MLRAVLFDLDGVLADTEGHILGAFNHALSSHGRPAITLDDMAKLAGLPLHEAYEKLAPGVDVDALRALHRDHQLANLPNLQPYPRLRRTLESLKRQRLALAVVTGRYRAGAERILGHLNVRRFFASLVCADDPLPPKPNAAPFLKAADELRVPPGECLVVGDGAADMLGGKAAGCVLARALYGYGAREPVSVKPDYALRALEGVLRVVAAEREKEF